MNLIALTIKHTHTHQHIFAPSCWFSFKLIHKQINNKFLQKKEKLKGKRKMYTHTTNSLKFSATYKRQEPYYTNKDGLINEHHVIIHVQ